MSAALGLELLQTRKETVTFEDIRKGGKLNNELSRVEWKEVDVCGCLRCRSCFLDRFFSSVFPHFLVWHAVPICISITSQHREANHADLQ